MKNELLTISPKTRTVVVWVLRVIVGGTFVFSGLVKAIDPWGGLYKIMEYLSVMHIDVTRETSLVLACLLSCVEFVSGILLVLGAFRRTVVWLLSAFMLVMTPLTLWIYVSNPVADCGCFGDAIILSNGATFAKNLFLCVMVAILLAYNSKVKGIYHYHLQWLVLVASAAFAGVLSIIGYFVQPVIDFRPFKSGSDLSDMVANERTPMFVYQKGTETKVFSADELPGDDWTFVERLQSDDKSGDLAIFDKDEDITSQLLDQSGNGGLLLLCVAHPERYGISRSRLANRLNDYMRENDGTFAAVIKAGNDSLLEKWIDDVEAKYEVYTADDTDIKSLVRGDAALVYIKDDIIKWKYNVYALSPEMVNEASAGSLLKIEPIEQKHLLLKLTVVYLSILCFLWMLAAFPIMLYKHRNTKNGTKVSIDK